MHFKWPTQNRKKTRSTPYSQTFQDSGMLISQPKSEYKSKRAPHVQLALFSNEIS